MPYFFFSYARADTDGYLDQFYDDLCKEVRARTGAAPNDIGFRDRTSLELGVHWPSRLTEALASSAVMVALCSPSYFASDQCGREWGIFAELVGARPRRSTSAPTLLPVMWFPASRPPDVARRLQHTHAGFGAVYRREGVHLLLRLRKYRDDYHEFVTRLAERIVVAAEPFPPPVPDELPDFEASRSAFTWDEAEGTAPGGGAPARTPSRTKVRVVAGPAAAERHAAPVAASGGPRHVNFVVVAAPSAEVSSVRSDVQFYGPTPHEWAPYKPVAPQRICVFAQSVASTRDLTSALRPAGPSIVRWLVEAREKNEIVVLLVDVWTTKLDPYHSWMVAYDERNAPTSAVMVPWNEADDEMAEHRDELRNDLRAAFPNNTTRTDPVFRSAIGSLGEFRTALEDVLAEAQARIFDLGTVARRAGGDQSIDRPIL